MIIEIGDMVRIIDYESRVLYCKNIGFTSMVRPDPTWGNWGKLGKVIEDEYDRIYGKYLLELVDSNKRLVLTKDMFSLDVAYIRDKKLSELGI